MIKIEHIQEFENKLPDAPHEQFNLHPSRVMSSQELSDFISNEFQKAHDLTEFGSYEGLLNDVFSYSEEDIDIKIESNAKLTQILESFKPEEWTMLDKAEKLVSLQKLEHLICDILGLDSVPEIELYDGDIDDCGFYSPIYEIIGLNENYLDAPTELVNTLAHEIRHVYQHFRADMLETHEDALFKVNFENYISPVSLPDGTCLFFMEYWNQYVEVDARAFANKFTEILNYA